MPYKKSFVGAYYSFAIDRGFVEDDIVYAEMVSHFINLHYRNQLSKRWSLGGEGIMAIVASPRSVNNPLFLFGIHGEFLIHNGKIIKVYGRL